MKEEQEEHTPDRTISLTGYVWRIGVVVFCLAAGVGLGLILWITNGLQPVEAQEEEVRLTIERGMLSSDVAQLLEDEGLIRSQMIFSYYLRLNGEGHRFQAGTYDLNPGVTLDDIIEKFNNGETIEEEMIRFTIPEGFNIEQIAQRLADVDVWVDPDRFLEWVQEPYELENELVQHIPQDEQIKYPLEGYLFPETYEMRRASTEQEVIERLLTEMERRLNLIAQDWSEILEEREMTLHELLTIASIIEREVAVNEEQAIVSSIIYNRLSRGMDLQIDATIQYILGEQQETVLYEDLEIDDPYNTYRYNGLPPGPIASPGVSAIRAALHPDETPYLFYVTKKDGTREHYFAETYEEHLANDRRSRENEQSGGETEG